MPAPIPPFRITDTWKLFTTHDQLLLLVSVFLQLVLALLFGHFYDMRIFMATGYLVSSGQNPYIAQDLVSVFNNNSFHGMTTVGYPPLWPLVLGLLYLSVYTYLPNFLIYNLAIKIPVIVANICLAYLVADILKGLGADVAVYRRAWIFLLFNPFVLYFASAWGQFDSIVTLLSLLSLVFLPMGKFRNSAILLALAISLKPISFPILLVVFVYLIGKSPRQAINYFAMFLVSVLLFCALPFIIFGWDPSPILRGWNAHFTVGGGMSFMAFFELLKDSYQLPGQWWLLSLAWIPALGFGILALKHGIDGFVDLLKGSTGLVLIFYLTRAWLSEPNIFLILTFVLILTSIGELDNFTLTAIWILPLAFTFFNASLPQLFFPSLPGIMDRMLKLAEDFRSARIIARTALVIPWQIVGWRVVVSCFRRNPATVGGIRCG